MEMTGGMASMIGLKSSQPYNKTLYPSREVGALPDGQSPVATG